MIGRVGQSCRDTGTKVYCADKVAIITCQHILVLEFPFFLFTKNVKLLLCITVVFDSQMASKATLIQLVSYLII